PEEAELYGYKKNSHGTIIQQANQEAIANRVYANRNGNGDISSGDGWKYRGKGIIQVTGKDKYDKINDVLNKKLPNFKTEIDSKNITTYRTGVIASMAYWHGNGLYTKANMGID